MIDANGAAREVRGDADRGVDVAIVGGGPCGLAAAIAVQRVGLSGTVFERGCLVSGIYSYPTYMTFFSTAERLSIGGVPFVVATEKPTRRDALAYYRMIARHFALDVRQYETVSQIERLPDASDERAVATAGAGAAGAAGAASSTGAAVRATAGRAVSAEESGGRGAPPDMSLLLAGANAATPSPAGAISRDGAPEASRHAGGDGAGVARGDESVAQGAEGEGERTAAGRRSLRPRFRVRSVSRFGKVRVTDVGAVIIATGYFGHPNTLGVPGEDLPHVTHLFKEGHEAFDQPVVVVGGGNSAVDAALDLYRAGARVTLVHFLPQLDPNIKPWVRPDIENRIADGSVAAKFESQVAAIDPEWVVATTPRGPERVRADHVYLMLGYQPNAALLQDLGVPIDASTGIPAHDPATMETAVAGVFIAGVLASGYDANKTFIENGRHHGDLIATRLAQG